MAVKDGLPATDFSRMNREYIRNVAEGETVKDGLPATDFSRMNREYIKAVVEEAGGGGGSITVESLTVTENDTYTAPEGKAYSPVIVNVPGGGGGGNYTTATMTITDRGAYMNQNFSIPHIVSHDGTDYLNPSVYINVGTFTVLLLNGMGSAYFDPNVVENWEITVTGDAEYADGYLDYFGDFSIAFGNHS